MKQFFFVILSSLVFPYQALAQNTGIGTASPEAKLHVNGDLKLQYGFPVNKFSRDSLFAENSHNNVPTEKAIKDYLQKGQWASVIDSTVIGSQAPLARGFVHDFLLNGPVAVAQSGNHVYVASYNDDRLVSVNITNPDSPYFEDDIAVNMDGPVDVHVQGNFAYVASENNDRLCIFDISNPNNMLARGFTSTNIRRPTSVYVSGNYAYVTSDLFNRLSIHDISNPDAIVAMGMTSTNMSLPVDVFVNGNFAYLVSAANNRFCIYDVSNPNAIVPRGFTSSGLDAPTSVYVKGNYAYVLSRNPGFSGRIRVYNISNPDAIALSGSSAAEFSQSNKLHGSGNALFVADGNSLYLYDISNPVITRPAGVSTTNLSGAISVFANVDYAYVASNSNNRLCIFDLNRSNELQVTAAGIQPAPLQWQISNGNVYRSNGFVGINTSQPMAPLHVEGSAYINGYMGIGTGSNIPEARLHLPAETGEKIILWGQPFTGTSYGIGVQGGLLQIHANTSTDNIGLGYGSSTSFTEVMRIKGNGNVGIGTVNPTRPLSFPAVLGEKILLFPAAGGEVGMGVYNNEFRIHTDYNGADITFGHQNNTPVFTETMRIKGTGLVGIGNNNPTRPLSFPAALGEKILLYPGGAGEVGIGVYGNELRLHCDNPGSMVSFGTQDNAGVFTQAGRFQISGGYALYVNGNIWANGTTYASDERFKQDITPIESPLQKLIQLNGVEYEMKKEAFAKNNFMPGRQMGLLAQNVETVVPEAVRELDGYKGVDYARLVPLLIESIKELNRQNGNQQKEITELRSLLQNKQQ